jgi:prolyl-tRNA editing enzyme YbaK/EbsC (Cys-tRNA(Pro) deacylase)
MPDKSILPDNVRAALDANGLDYDVLACEPHLADTAEFCEHYGFTPDMTLNAIIVVLKTNPRGYVACLVRFDTKLDVNHKVSDIVGVKRVSFASGEETATLTGMLIGGVTIAGLPPEIPILIDQRVMEKEKVIIGGGNRHSKVYLAPAELLKLPNARVEDVAIPR